MCLFCLVAPSGQHYYWPLSKGSCSVLQHLHEVLTATEAGRDSNINNSMENIMPRVKLIDASLKVSALGTKRCIGQWSNQEHWLQQW